MRSPTAIKRVLADSRRVFGHRALIVELFGGPLVALLLGVLALGVAVVVGP